MIKNRLEALRKLMKEKNIDIIMIPTADFHGSEYVGDYFKCRHFISGFSGSAGTVVVTHNHAGLWTDGRYYIQAEKQLMDSTITLYKMGEENVPSVIDYIEGTISAGETLGFDGRVISCEKGEEIEKCIAKKKAYIKYDEDLINQIWSDRPELSHEKAYLIEEKFSGMSTSEKIKQVRQLLDKENVDLHIITSLDDIAWLFNIRGNDVESNPVILSYAIITSNEAIIFLNHKVLDCNLISYFHNNNIIVKEYDEVYEYTKQISNQSKVLLDKSKVNYTISSLLKGNIVNCLNPTTVLKAVKNPIEIENTKKAHIRDGVAFTKFMYWLKENVNEKEMTEISASDYLYNQRASQEGFIELSFETICAYKENAAMMHYCANKNNNAKLEASGLLLVDSGGQYFEGTTDITRTMSLGTIDEAQKEHFTAVTRGMLHLMNAKFLYGIRGINLDILARGPIWELDIDYKCGTGHGVGHILNVHEGPNGIRPKLLKNNEMNCILEEGMITTDEPGIYIEGSHGIRIENELLCRKGNKNEHGQFMYFENITFAPIDLDAINPELMNVKEKKMLNDYHREVFSILSPYMNKEEVEWLKRYTRAI
ncbi:MAG: aminopeptidase P family protein [Lachnotalea sp.]